MSRHDRSVLLLMMAVFLLVGTEMGCRKGPMVSGGGKDVTNILITEQFSNTEVTVRPGDEVRWTNRRTTPVRVIFLSSVVGRLSCNYGFGGFMEPVESVLLAPDENAGVCFAQPGSMRYGVLTKRDPPSAGRSVIGLVRVWDDPAEP